MNINGGLDGKLDERLEETKNRIDAGAGLRGGFYRLFGSGGRCQDPEFKTSQRRRRSRSDANSNTDPKTNSARQTASDHDINCDADSDTPTHGASNRRANSD